MDMRSTITRMGNVFAAALLVAIPLAGCAEHPGAPTTDGPTGQLVLSLKQAGPPGELYTLSNALFDVTGAVGFSTPLDGSGFGSNEVDSDVPPGIANVTLRD